MNTTHLQRFGEKSRPSFDLEKYLRAAGVTRPETFDWSDPGPRLDDDALFCVGYMMDIESHTVIYRAEPDRGLRCQPAADFHLH